MSRLIVDGVIADQPVVPGVEKMYLYNYGKQFGGPHAFVYTSAFEIRNVNVPEKLEKVHTPFDHGAFDQAVEHGLLDPTADEYHELLIELCLGATGDGRVD
jgi:hypothetical protein